MKCRAVPLGSSEVAGTEARLPVARQGRFDILPRGRRHLKQER